ncbi:hypothetical protein GWI33_012308 [Rhynchophorus ferrugineus]|uniref:Ig-like domain-containing protein n=1 Tax=Rhynchophorus ferrugineus TaxID=354439 RepID=A0A834ITX4_RHYFE|nr:hypothetical protein GWI33_012308 [Rhynchophorus ferrugineus]
MCEAKDRARVPLVYIVFSLSLIIKDALCLKNVAVFIEPDVVQYKDKSTLRCTYDLEDDVLYSVKWYRGSREFYRYIPAEQPSIKFFPIPGVTADLARSNSSQVVLKDIEFNLAGNFSCEVTTDGQNIHTRIDSKSMLVVQLPVHPPEISVGREPLDYGDILRANCSSYPSRPPADLKFILNGITVNQSEPAALRKQNTNDWSDLQLELKLSFIHFNEGRLALQCVAQVSSIYREVAELELESLRHPVPARVSAPSNAAARTSQKIEYTLRLAAYFLLFSMILGRNHY